ncbi:hypothetical protein HDU76_010161, partial [Blyttiomyces sp. JEL0837]
MVVSTNTNNTTSNIYSVRSRHPITAHLPPHPPSEYVDVANTGARITSHNRTAYDFMSSSLMRSLKSLHSRNSSTSKLGDVDPRTAGPRAHFPLSVGGVGGVGVKGK